MTTHSAIKPPKRHVDPLAEAKKDGLFAGLTSGLASAVLGSRLFGFTRNTTIFCGVFTGAISGYLFTQAFISTALARQRVEEMELAPEKDEIRVPSTLEPK